MRILRTVAGIASFSILVACGPTQDTVLLTGRVLCDGQPVGEGTISLHRVDGLLDVEVPLRADGGFRFAGNLGLFPGEYVVVVAPPLVRPTSGFDARNEPELVPAASPIPESHRRAKTSPLRVELGPGETRREFDLVGPSMPSAEAVRRAVRDTRVESASEEDRSHVVPAARPDRVRVAGLDEGG